MTGKQIDRMFSYLLSSVRTARNLIRERRLNPHMTEQQIHSWDKRVDQWIAQFDQDDGNNWGFIDPMRVEEHRRKQRELRSESEEVDGQPNSE